MLACCLGHTDVVKLLLNHSNINVNVRENNGSAFGWNALMYACGNGHRDIVQLLLEDGRIELNARTYSMDSDGMTAFMIACRDRLCINVVKLLIEHSYPFINLNGSNNSGRTASMPNYSDRIDLYARDNSGRTASMIAEEKGQHDVVQLLKEACTQIEIYRAKEAKKGAKRPKVTFEDNDLEFANHRAKRAVVRVGHASEASDGGACRRPRN